jgi:hypothetical protein
MYEREKVTATATMRCDRRSAWEKWQSLNCGTKLLTRYDFYRILDASGQTIRKSLDKVVKVLPHDDEQRNHFRRN